MKRTPRFATRAAIKKASATARLRSSVFQDANSVIGAPTGPAA